MTTPCDRGLKSVLSQQGRAPFRISSVRLLENVNAKTTSNNFWGAVPFTAGLEGNVFAKRSGINNVFND